MGSWQELRFWLRFAERRAAVRWRQIAEAPIPDEFRERVRHEIERGQRQAAHHQRVWPPPDDHGPEKPVR